MTSIPDSRLQATKQTTASMRFSGTAQLHISPLGVGKTTLHFLIAQVEERKKSNSKLSAFSFYLCFQKISYPWIRGRDLAAYWCWYHGSTACSCIKHPFP
ncbi:hypothetical protein ACJQWK_06211 [Exserohilum turcicum]